MKAGSPGRSPMSPVPRRNRSSAWLWGNPMTRMKTHPVLSRLLSDHSMLLVLLAVCAYYSYAPLAEQHPGGAAGGEHLADDVLRQARQGAKVLIVARDTQE